MSIVGDLVGGFFQDKSARRADATQRYATDQEIAENRRQYDTTRADYAPYREQGINALRQLAGDIDKPVTSADVMADPGYQFGLEQGQSAIDRKIAAGGGRISGAALRAAARYGTDYASTGYGAAYQRKQDRLNRLAAIAGIGQTSTAGTAAAGQAATNNIGRAISDQGDASAASQIARGNIWANTSKNALSSLFTSGFGFSDVRLKMNVVHIGETARGNKLYSWDWIDGSGSAEGVLAHEVAHIPGAVKRHSSGYMMVDYSKV